MPRVIRVTINKTQGDLGLASPLPLGCDGPKQSSLKALGISPTTSFPGGIRPGPELTWYGLKSAEQIVFFLDQSHFCNSERICDYDLYINASVIRSEAQRANTGDTIALMCYIWHVLTRLLFHGHSNWCLILPDTQKPAIDPRGVVIPN